MKKELLTPTKAKNEFVNSIFKWLIDTLKKNGHEKDVSMFTKEGSSIMCTLPSYFFDKYEVPEGTRIEMKFIAKKD